MGLLRVLMLLTVARQPSLLSYRLMKRVIYTASLSIKPTKFGNPLAERAPSRGRAAPHKRRRARRNKLLHAAQHGSSLGV